MAIINKTGITSGGTIQAEHVTRAIDALSGGSTDTVVATGSFSGSFKGDGSQLSGISAGFPFTGSARITGSLIVTGSFQQRGASGVLINSNNNGTLSLAYDILSITGSAVTVDSNSSLDLTNIEKGSGFRIPLVSPGAGATKGTMYFDTGSLQLWIHDGTQWTYVTLST